MRFYQSSLGSLIFTVVLLHVSIVFCDEAARRPNIVFMLADDLGWGELGCYGQKKIPTPNIDRLAAQGMRFTQHYSGAPVCAPSRCVLMTGKHLGHAEVRGNLQAKVVFPQFAEGQFPLSEQALTFVQLLQRSGYATGAMGKWGLGPVGSTGEPSRKGFDLFFGYNCQGVAHSYYPASLWRNSESISINKKPIPGHAKQLDGDVTLNEWIGESYAPEWMVEEAEKFIVANADKPFFLYLPFIEPHVAMHPPRETVEKFPVEWDQEAYRGESGYLPHPRPHAGYAAMISELDDHVGRILESLEKSSVASNTVVIFSSDNGATHAGPPGTQFHVGGADPKFFNSTAGLRSYKGSVYEGGIRVPMIVRYPSIANAGVVSEMPSYFADWFPTICDIARIAKPADLDGESLFPIIKGKMTFFDRKPMIWVFPEYGGQVAVRIGDLKAVRQGLKTKQPGPWEVYDLKQDVYEEHDLAESQRDWIERVERLLKSEVAENKRFPLEIPGGQRK